MFGIESVEECERSLATICRAIDPDTIPLPDVAAFYQCLARMEKLVAGARLRLATRVEQSNEWRRTGHRRAADWVAHMTGTTAGAAQTELDTSKRLSSLPATDDALRHGDLSATQAAAVADAATADPAAETRLLEKAARASVRGLREECARTKAAADPDADARYERLHRERSLRSYTDQEGAWNLHARGPAHLGAQVMAALDSLTDELFQRAHAERRQEPREAYAFDALVALAESGSGRTGTKYRALVRVDLEALTRGATEGEERCEVTGIGPIPVRVARQVLGDAIVDLLVTRGRDVATVVHLGRGPTATQKLALLWSQPTCSRQGCEQLWTFTEVDHRVPWADTHQTVLDGLDRLCRHDHRLKTHDGWALVAGTGVRPMVPPGHPDHPGPASTQGPDPP
jgi:hypothetical protein